MCFGILNVFAASRTLAISNRSLCEYIVSIHIMLSTYFLLYLYRLLHSPNHNWRLFKRTIFFSHTHTLSILTSLCYIHSYVYMYRFIQTCYYRYFFIFMLYARTTFLYIITDSFIMRCSCFKFNSCKRQVPCVTSSIFKDIWKF